MPFPSPPWRLRGELWLSLFAVGRSTAQRPAGLYGAAFVDYRRGGVLTYRELVVARLVRDGLTPRLHVSDIWVDSETSRAGGRALWAIPKDLAALSVHERRLGPTRQAAWSARVDGIPLASAAFTALPPIPVRTPFAFTLAQSREDGHPVVTAASGSARVLPCTGGWRFGADGPLAWLREGRAVGSFRVGDFRLTFGR